MRRSCPECPQNTPHGSLTKFMMLCLTTLNTQMEKTCGNKDNGPHKEIEEFIGPHIGGRYLKEHQNKLSKQNVVIFTKRLLGGTQTTPLFNIRI